MDLDALLQIVFGTAATVLAAIALYVAVTTAKNGKLTRVSCLLSSYSCESPQLRDHTFRSTNRS